MIWIHSKNLDILVTPHHPIPFLDRNKKRLHWHLAFERTTHDYLIRKARFSGYKPDFWEIPEYYNEYWCGHYHSSHREYFKPKLKVPIEDFLRLLGWYLSEGNIFKEGFYISQSKLKHPKYCAEISALLSRLGLNVDYNFNNTTKGGYFRVFSMQWRQYFAQFGESEERFIPEDIKNLDGSLLEILLETLMKGDGAKTGFYYWTDSKQLADDLQEIALKTGRYIPWISSRIRNGKVEYSVHMKQTDSSPNKKHYDEVKYSGKIWYIETENQTLCVRRNTKPVFLHNTAGTMLAILHKVGKEYHLIDLLEWKMQKYDDVQDWIESVTELYKPDYIFVDALPKGESERTVDRLGQKGYTVTPVFFSQEKSRYQTRMRSLFSLGQIWIPESFVDLLEELRAYEWTTKRGDDRVVALMLALIDPEPSESQSVFGIAARPISRPLSHRL